MKPSTVLEAILWFKIVFTIFAWSLPLLLSPASLFVRLGMPEPMPLLWVRLLGAAFFALSVGYGFGLRDLRQYRDITSTIWMGIVSNGSASLLLLYFGCQGEWLIWGRLAQGVLWLSCIITGLVTVGLVTVGLVTVGLVSAGLINGGARGK